ncbi:MAG: PASTA domain-containing protein [Treponema sp.]|nr:PASTA domain-containing protein [Treponema sp.]
MAEFKRFNMLEGYAANHLRLFLSLAAGALVLAGFAALAAFFVALQGAEQTMVPDVRDKDLTEALLELQAKELYPRIQLRYSPSASERGMILEQDPQAGTIVKAGRRIRLVVSRGAVLNVVEDYRGRNIEEVQMDLRSLFASTPQPLLSLKEPFMYEFSSEAAGTILQQSPEPGTPLTGPVSLTLVVSRGLEQKTISAPDLIGVSYSEALARLASGDIRFRFSLQPAQEGEPPGTVVFQSPEPGSSMGPGIRLSLTLAAPSEAADGESFAVFTYLLPENLYPQPVRLEALLPSGERRLLAELGHSGGELSVPYRAPAGSFLILSMLNRELYRVELRPYTDPLSLDQL